MQLRKEILELAHELKLPGIVQCFDEVMQAATRNSWHPEQIGAELLKAELAEKTARSICYQMGVAKFPISKSLAEFDFTASRENNGFAALPPPSQHPPGVKHPRRPGHGMQPQMSPCSTFRLAVSWG